MDRTITLAVTIRANHDISYIDQDDAKAALTDLLPEGASCTGVEVVSVTFPEPDLRDRVADALIEAGIDAYVGVIRGTESEFVVEVFDTVDEPFTGFGPLMARLDTDEVEDGDPYAETMTEDPYGDGDVAYFDAYSLADYEF